MTDPWVRIGKLVAMLSSTFDGEVLVARAKINKALVDNKLSWSDLAQRVQAGAPNKAFAFEEDGFDDDEDEEDTTVDDIYREASRQKYSKIEYPYWHGAQFVCYGTIVRITHKALLIHLSHRASVDWLPLSMINKAPYPHRIGATGAFWLDAWIVRKKNLEGYES